MPHTSSSSILFKVKCEENLLKVGQANKINSNDIQSFSIQGDGHQLFSWGSDFEIQSLASIF